MPATTVLNEMIKLRKVNDMYKGGYPSVNTSYSENVKALNKPYSKRFKKILEAIFKPMTPNKTRMITPDGEEHDWTVFCEETGCVAAPEMQSQITTLTKERDEALAKLDDFHKVQFPIHEASLKMGAELGRTKNKLNEAIEVLRELANYPSNLPWQKQLIDLITRAKELLNQAK